MITLSGGEFGGESFDATLLEIGAEFVVNNSSYRKVSNEHGIYIGEIS